MSKKLTYEYIKEYIEKEGYVLLSKEYVNNRTRLSLLCKCREEHNITFSNFVAGKRCGKCRKLSEEHRRKIGKSLKGKNNPLWRGGVSKNNIPLYDTYAHQISYAEQTRRNKEDGKILEVKCNYCKKWYTPKMSNVCNRIQCLNGNMKHGENRLYCSDDCKQECPVFNQQKYPKGEKPYYSREVQPELRQMVFERDNWTCQKCKSKKNLHCHHIEGIRWEPLESSDIDKCITVCLSCHDTIHSKNGCKKSDMQCKEI